MNTLEYNKEVGFFTEETIDNLEGFLKGYKRSGYHFRLEGKIKIISPDRVEPIGYSNVIGFGITRQAAPIYTLGGSSDPRQFSRGQRGIAGTVQIDKNILLNHYKGETLMFVFEEIANDDRIQVILEGIELLREGETLTLDAVRQAEKDEWTFIGKKVSVRRSPANNKAFSRQLLTKEWVPQWPQ